MIKLDCDKCNQEINSKALGYNIQINCKNNDNRNIVICESCHIEFTKKIANIFEFKNFNHRSIKEIIIKNENEK